MSKRGQVVGELKRFVGEYSRGAQFFNVVTECFFSLFFVAGIEGYVIWEWFYSLIAILSLLPG